VGGVFSNFDWQEGLLIVLVFLASGISNAGGVGGGLLFVPLLALLASFPIPQASANSQSLILGASIANTVYNIRKRHIIRDAPRIDWNLVISTLPFFLSGTTPGYFLNISLPAYFTGFVLTAMLGALTIQSFLSGTRMTRRQWRRRREQPEHERQQTHAGAQRVEAASHDEAQGPSRKSPSPLQLETAIRIDQKEHIFAHPETHVSEQSNLRGSAHAASDLEATAPRIIHATATSARLIEQQETRGPVAPSIGGADPSVAEAQSGTSSVSRSECSCADPSSGDAQQLGPSLALHHRSAVALHHPEDTSLHTGQQGERITHFEESEILSDGTRSMTGLRRSISAQDSDLRLRRRLPRDDSVASCLSLHPRSRHSHSGVLRTASLYEDLAGLYTVHINEPEGRSRSKTTSTDQMTDAPATETDGTDWSQSKAGRFWRFLDPVLFSQNLEEMLEAERPWFPWRHVIFLVFLVLILFVGQFLSGAPYARSPVGVPLCGAVFWVIFTLQEVCLFSIGILTVFRNRRLRRLRSEYGYPRFEHDGLTDMRWDGSNLYIYPVFVLVIGAIDSWTGLSSSALIIPYLYLIAKTDLVTVQSSMAVVNLVASLAAAMVFLVDGRLNIGYSLFYGLWAMLGSYSGVFFVYYLVDRFQIRAFIILAISIAFLAAFAIVLYESIHNVLAAQAAGVGWQMVNICKATYS
jgi:uncharacterized membrane protein YfcA